MAKAMHDRLMGTCNRIPITLALWKMDKGPNCFNAELITGFNARTRRKCAQLHTKINTHESNPSNVETLVIDGGGRGADFPWLLFLLPHVPHCHGPFQNLFAI